MGSRIKQELGEVPAGYADVQVDMAAWLQWLENHQEKPLKGTSGFRLSSLGLGFRVMLYGIDVGIWESSDLRIRALRGRFWGLWSFRGWVSVVSFRVGGFQA